MIEDIELGSGGCVADMCEVLNKDLKISQKEIQIDDILNSPFTNKIKELFQPTKIVVKAKV